MTGLQVTAILLNGSIMPIGGASAVKGLRLQSAQQACLLPYTHFLGFYFIQWPIVQSFDRW